MELGVLGPLELRLMRTAMPLGPRKQQLVLATLAAEANRLVTVDDLVDELWPDRPPASAVANVRNYACSLRRLFLEARSDEGPLTRRGSGYVLSVADDELDLLSFQRDVRACPGGDP